MRKDVRERKEIHENIAEEVQCCLDIQSRDAERGEGYETVVSEISLKYASIVHVHFFVPILNIAAYEPTNSPKII